MEHPIFELKDVSLSKGGVPILDEASLVIEKSRVTSIMGVSGSGKTTLLKMIAGLIPPDQGKVLFYGKNIFSLGKGQNERFRRRMGFVFQDAALWANKTIYNNLFIPLKYHRPKMKNKEIDSLIMSRLEHNHMSSDRNNRPAQLSSGEQKIISFIRGLINDPEILFLDNPLLSLDHEASEIIKDQLIQKKKEGNTIVICSQDHEFLSQITDNVIIIEDGKILNSGPLSDLRSSENPRIQRILEKLLGESSVYDQDILEILDENDPSGLFS